MKILTKWLRSYLPGLPVDDARLAEDLTLRGIAVEGIYDLGEGNGSLYEMDITTNRVDAMNHYGVAREAAAIYGLALPELNFALPEARPVAVPYSARNRPELRCRRVGHHHHFVFVQIAVDLEDGRTGKLAAGQNLGGPAHGAPHGPL